MSDDALRAAIAKAAAGLARALPITYRNAEVVAALLVGGTRQAVADVLGIQLSTVHSHIKIACRRLGLAPTGPGVRDRRALLWEVCAPYFNPSDQEGDMATKGKGGDGGGQQGKGEVKREIVVLGSLPSACPKCTVIFLAGWSPAVQEAWERGEVIPCTNARCKVGFRRASE